MKINFWEAWKMWRNDVKTIDGHHITFGTLVLIAISSIVQTTVGFFTRIFWERICYRQDEKEE